RQRLLASLEDVDRPARRSLQCRKHRGMMVDGNRHQRRLQGHRRERVDRHAHGHAVIEGSDYRDAGGEPATEVAELVWIHGIARSVWGPGSPALGGAALAL